jgi:hypothetical protein
MTTTPPGILNVLLRRRPVAAAVAAVVDAIDSNETLSEKAIDMTTASPTATTPTAPAPLAAAAPVVAAAPDVLATIGGGGPASLEQLEAAFAGENDFVLASLREKRTMAQAQSAYVAVLKDRNAKLAAQVAEKDSAIKGLGSDGLGITAAPAAVVDAAASETGEQGGFKTYEQAVEHYQKAGDKQAYRTAATKHPKLHIAWRATQGEKGNAAAEARELRRRSGKAD